MFYEAILDVKAREVIDSRGNPTVEVDVITESGFGRAIVPSGASKGKNEALELRDGDERFGGRGVLRAVKNVNTIIKSEIVGMNVFNQRELDETLKSLDGTPNKSSLGANAILGVSLAACKAAADALAAPLYRYLGGVASYTLPTPMMNVLNGGRHAGNELSIQEFLIIPMGESFREALRMGVEVYHELKRVLREKYGVLATNVGDEGGYAPPMRETREALDALIEAIEAAGYDAGGRGANAVNLGLDAAASSFYDERRGVYTVDGAEMDEGELLEFYVELVKTYPIISIEDPFWEEAFESFAEFTRRLDIIVVGDDLFVTNPQRIADGIRVGAANALLLKLNQIGTVSEALEAARLAAANRYKIVVSHRSGETEDTSIADLAVALNAELIKTGAPARGERTAKYNQLLRIEEELGDAAKYEPERLFR